MTPCVEPPLSLPAAAAAAAGPKQGLEKCMMTEKAAAAKRLQQQTKHCPRGEEEMKLKKHSGKRGVSFFLNSKTFFNAAAATAASFYANLSLFSLVLQEEAADPSNSAAAATVFLGFGCAVGEEVLS